MRLCFVMFTFFCGFATNTHASATLRAAVIAKYNLQVHDHTTTPPTPLKKNLKPDDERSVSPSSSTCGTGAEDSDPESMLIRSYSARSESRSGAKSMPPMLLGSCEELTDLHNNKQFRRSNSANVFVGFDWSCETLSDCYTTTPSPKTPKKNRCRSARGSARDCHTQTPSPVSPKKP